MNPREALVDPQGAVFHSILLLVTLAVLVGTSFTEGVHVWAVTLAGGGLGVIRDFIFDLHQGKRHRHGGKIAADLPNGQGSENGTQDPNKHVIAKDRPLPAPKAATYQQHSVDDSRDENITLPSLWRKASHRFPNLTMTLSRLPWPLLPFAVGMFILVQSLEHLGYISIFASWTAKACHSPAQAVFFVGCIVAFGLCPLCGTVSTR